MPFATDVLLGVTLIEVSVADVMSMSSVPVTLPKLAETVVDPMPKPEIKPCDPATLLTVATEGVDDDHVTCAASC